MGLDVVLSRRKIVRFSVSWSKDPISLVLWGETSRINRRRILGVPISREIGPDFLPEREAERSVMLFLSSFSFNMMLFLSSCVYTCPRHRFSFSNLLAIPSRIFWFVQLLLKSSVCLHLRVCRNTRRLTVDFPAHKSTNRES